MDNSYQILFAQYQSWLAGRSNSLIIAPQDDILKKYDWLKSSARDAQMGVLSVNNRRVILLSPGTYTLNEMLVLDTDFVDIASLSLNPVDARIIGTISPAVVKQTAQNIVMANFTIKSLYNFAIGFYGSFLIDSPDNSASKYYFMHFRHKKPGGITGLTNRTPVGSYQHLNGFWFQCEGDSYSWNCKKDMDLSATMYYCQAGDSSFFKDNAGDITGTGKLSGTLIGCIAGKQSFGGCASFGSDVTGYLQDCKAGDLSYALGKTFSGKAIRCTGEDGCFGGCAGAIYDPGTFSGYAEDSNAKSRSFGSGRDTAKCSGELVRCKCTEMPEAMFTEGAILRDSYLQVTGTDKNCLDLNDSNTKVHNCTLIANGTGKSITAGEAQNVFAVHCRMNKDKHANVTNLIGDGSLLAGLCIVSDEVS